MKQVAAIALLALLVGAPAQAPAQASDHPARGAALYGEHCAACHGVKLEGEPNWRQRKANGRLPAPPHDETGHTWHHPDQMLFDVTKYGVAAFAPEGYESDMIGFGDILSDDEIVAVIAYIKSTWPEEIRLRQEALTQKYRAQ